MTAATLRPSRPASRGLLVFAMVLPTAVTWLYFVALDSAPAAAQQSAYAIGKAIQFALPIAWSVGMLGERPRWPRLRRDGGRRNGVIEGLAFGAVVVAAMWAVYLLILVPSGHFEGPAEAIRAKILGIGVASPAAYLALGLFYSLGHSGLEEYYWRWFVYRHLLGHVRPSAALVLSSLFFAAHHVLLLVHFFGATSPLAYLLAAGVAIGGAYWAWLYRRAESIVAPWLSHLVIDAGIFALGYYLARELFNA